MNSTQLAVTAHDNKVGNANNYLNPVLKGETITSLAKREAQTANVTTVFNARINSQVAVNHPAR